jgi:predicted AlkP superfamily pyrophosphatase or phosphodiesterase
MRVRSSGLLMKSALAAAGAAVAAMALAGDDQAGRKGGAQPRKPQVVVISLDGAKPDLIEQYLKTGVLDKRKGLGALAKFGVVAEQNVTVTPSVTAVSHIAIATGSLAAHNDIPGNTYHAVAQPIAASTSGFAGPIGGYQISPLGPKDQPTAQPLWVRLREAGKSVVTATWPGGDGLDVRLTGTVPNNVVQPAAPTRTVDFTVPFGAFGGIGARGFEKTAANFAAAPQTLIDQLAAAGRTSYSPILETLVENLSCTATCAENSSLAVKYQMRAAALDTTDDNAVNYDTLVFYDANAGVQTGPFALPATGPAYVKAGGPSGKFYLEGSGNKVGTAYFVTHLAPNLSTVRFMRYGANFIPRNAAVLADVDDINANVGFWAPQPDFRIIEKISPGFDNFPDLELEASYRDQVRTFVDYQTRVGLRGMARVPEADLVMIYIEQPDGSGHQFTLTDPRQATDFRNPLTIGTPNNPPGAAGQDMAKVKRYAELLAFGYKEADRAVQRIMETVGTDRRGEPKRDIFVVSDHGMAPFHTAVQLGNLLSAAGIDLNKIAIRSTGPAVNIYVDLEGREPVSAAPRVKVPVAEYQGLVDQIAAVLRNAQDGNEYYNPTKAKLFSHVWTRPGNCGQPGFCTDTQFGQDTGDVLALLIEGYNFDGTQNPVVKRLGDQESAVYSVPNFYGAHGHDSHLESMSAILYAAGPSIKQGRKVRTVRNIDVAPTVMELLGVSPGATVDGEPLQRILKRRDD